MTGGVRVLMAHPSTELYGADRMFLRSVEAVVAAGCDVTVTVPDEGPLTAALRGTGVGVVVHAVPVLRKGSLSPAGLVRLAVRGLSSLPRQLALARQVDVVYVNTVTVPTWLLAGRLLHRRTVVHVREAEDDATTVLRWALLAPLLLAHLAVCNSRATEAFTRRWPLGRRLRTAVVYNGLELPDAARPAPGGRVLRLAVVGRLSPRKGQDVLLAAMAELRERGVPTALTLAGDAFDGYAWYVDELHRAAVGLDVQFLGFVPDPAPVYECADVVVVPSRTEPFGNVAVEALAAGRPVVASAVQGLVEVLADGGGVLVPADDPTALADALLALAETSREVRDSTARRGREQVLRRFGLERYREELAAAVLDHRRAAVGR